MNVFNLAKISKDDLVRLKDLISVLAAYGFGEVSDIYLYRRVSRV
ncbi:MAG: hypothetical protein ABIH89_05460 [Elusimicrobiota bacterium]